MSCFSLFSGGLARCRGPIGDSQGASAPETGVPSRRATRKASPPGAAVVGGDRTVAGRDRRQALNGLRFTVSTKVRWISRRGTGGHGERGGHSGSEAQLEDGGAQRL